MTRRFVLRLALVCLLAGARPALAQVDLTIRPARTKYRVGEQVLLYVRITNRGAAPMWVPNPTDFCSSSLPIGGLLLRVAPKSQQASVTTCAGDPGIGNAHDAVTMVPRFSARLLPSASIEVPILADTWTARLPGRVTLRVELDPMQLDEQQKAALKQANLGDVLQQKLLSNPVKIFVRR